MKDETLKSSENKRAGLMLERWNATTKISSDAGIDASARSHLPGSQSNIADQPNIRITKWKLGSDLISLDENTDSCGCGCG